MVYKSRRREKEMRDKNEEKVKRKLTNVNERKIQMKRIKNTKRKYKEGAELSL
jgi:hypothetical protein